MMTVKLFLLNGLEIIHIKAYLIKINDFRRLTEATKLFMPFPITLSFRFVTELKVLCYIRIFFSS